MLRSMTGFGSSTVDTGEGSVTVELRSVNARHLRLDLRLPPGTESWEPLVREALGERLERGSVDADVEVDVGGGEGSGLELDEDRVEAFLKACDRLRKEYALPGQVDLAMVVGSGAVLRPAETAYGELVDEDHLLAAVRGALEELVAMREEEGRRLGVDLRERIDAVRSGLDRVEELAPERLDRERRRLREAVDELLEERGEDDDQRVAREIALLADKWDVGEEVVRARSHLDAFEELLDVPSAEPVGKRLKFLVQELHREVNTTGAKANDAEISRAVVDMKNEIEKLREQIENVE